MAWLPSEPSGTMVRYDRRLSRHGQGTGSASTTPHHGRSVIVTSTVEAPAQASVPTSGELDPRQLGIHAEAKLVEWQIPYEYQPAFPLDEIRVADWIQVREARHLADKE